jgi:hypothetical protein
MNYSSLIKWITGAPHRLQEHVATVANQALVIRNWLVGAWLVEFEQNGKDRAQYGQKLLETVAADLAKKEIKGLADARVLRDCRVLYRVYPQIRGSATRELPPPLVLEDLMRHSWAHLQERSIRDIMVFGQESYLSTWRLAAMNRVMPPSTLTSAMNRRTLSTAISTRTYARTCFETGKR